KAQAIPCGGDNRLIRPFLGRLGFKLTDEQTRVLRELRQELSGAHPMRRLLQGDVGSGKTVVAACCALMALESGHNVAPMAPTEILDEHHLLSFRRWTATLGVAQLEEVVRKGKYPHLLVMTATPIPRTLGLTLYGDLDLSTINQLPPGRGRIHTFVRGAETLPKVWGFVRGKLQEGRQVYVV